MPDRTDRRDLDEAEEVRAIVLKPEGEHYVLTLGDRGRLVLPASVRHELGLNAGERLILTVTDDGTLRIESFADRVKRLRGSLAHLGPVSMADELLEERAREAKAELADA
jgi:AbrB family looped-hinge helix DNA binding protein